MNTTKIIITTERLKLIPLSKNYARDIFKNLTGEITTYMFPKTPSKIEETLEYINFQIPKMENGEEFPVIILSNKTNEFLGCGGIHSLKTKTPKLGIWIKKDAHGNKYGLETVQGLKKWIDENLGYDYIIYPVDKRNIPSCKIAENLGGKIMKEYKKINGSGNILDVVEYWIYKNK